MLRLLSLAIAAMASFTVLTAAEGDKPADKPAAAGKEATDLKCEGSATAVDVAAKTITVQEKAKKGDKEAPAAKTFTLTEKTDINISHANGKLDQIAVGDEVTVLYVVEGDKTVVKRVTKHVRKEKKDAEDKAK